MTSGTSGQPIEPIDVYWRPGCPYCMALRAGLRLAGIPSNRHNIWKSPADAAAVREVAGGNETVPTVRVGSTWLVNPTVGQVKRAMAAEGHGG